MKNAQPKTQEEMTRDIAATIEQMSNEINFVGILKTLNSGAKFTRGTLEAVIEHIDSLLQSTEKGDGV